MIRRRLPAPPPADWLALLRFDTSEGAPAAARVRVLGRLQADLTAGVTAPDLPPGPPAGSSGLALLGANVLGRIAARPKRLALVTFALGAAGGAALHAWLQNPRADRVVYVDRIVAGPVTAPAAPPSNVTGGDPSQAPALAPVSPVEPAPNLLTRSLPSGGAHDLAAERALLDRVQSALRAGDVSGAQRAIGAHARRFPTGILAEEREALAIKTLVAAGRHQEAQKRAAKFRERFPEGLFRPSVDEAVESIP